MINVRPPPPRYSPENVEIKVTSKHLFPWRAQAVNTCCMHIPAHDDDDDNDDDDDDDDDDDLYIIGAVRPSVRHKSHYFAVSPNWSPPDDPF